MTKMRTPDEMFGLIKRVAEEDERILAVMLNGSRANPDAPADIYQDFDIVYFVSDTAPFWNNRKWLEEKFGRVILIQTPETMRLVPPDGNGDFVYLAIFEDGNRLDLTVTSRKYENSGEPAVVLIDKCGLLSEVAPKKGYWNISTPDQKLFSDCCNEFWWCLNNAVKGIARDELPYSADMLNGCVRDMLNLMVGWYIGATRGFDVSVGKAGKYFKRLLPENIYRRYERTYFTADSIKPAMYEMMSLFSELARLVAERFGFE